METQKKSPIEQIGNHWILVSVFLVLALAAAISKPLYDWNNAQKAKIVDLEDRIGELSKTNEKLTEYKNKYLELIGRLPPDPDDSSTESDDLLERIVLVPGENPDLNISEWQRDLKFCAPKASSAWKHEILRVEHLFPNLGGDSTTSIGKIPVHIWKGTRPTDVILNNDMMISDMAPMIFVTKIPYEEIDPIIPPVAGAVLREVVKNSPMAQLMATQSTEQQYAFLVQVLQNLLQMSNLPPDTQADILEITWTRELNYNLLDSQSVVVFHDVDVMASKDSPQILSYFRDYNIWMRTIVISDNSGGNTDFYLLHALFPTPEDIAEDEYIKLFNNFWLDAFNVRF